MKYSISKSSSGTHPAPKKVHGEITRSARNAFHANAGTGGTFGTGHAPSHHTSLKKVGSKHATHHTSHMTGY